MLERVVDCRVYLEGVQVPFNTVHIEERVNSPMSTCQISLAPAAASREIEHRTMVHVIVKRTTPSRSEQAYECIFEGEVAGFGTSQSAGGSRTVTVIAYGLGNYWQWAKLQYMDAAAVSGTVTPRSVSTENVTQNQTGTIATVSVTREENQSTVQLSSSIHDAMSGVSFGEGIKNLFNLAMKKQAGKKEAYQFIVDANDRLKLTDRVVIAATDLGKFMEPTSFSFYVQQLMVGTGNFIDLGQVLDVAMQACFHEFVATAAPMRRGLDAGAAQRRADAVKALIADPSAANREALKEANRKQQSQVEIGSYIFKPSSYFLPPPSCNVLFPNQYSSMNYGRSFHAEPTRLYYISQPPTATVTPDVDSASRVFQKNHIAPASRFIGNKPLVTGRDGSIVDNAPVQRQTFEQLLNSGRAWGVEYNFLTDQELRTGCKPIVQEWPVLATLLAEYQHRTGGSQGSIDYEDDRWQSIADWMFWLSYYSVGRSQSISSEFNPYVIAGFPMIALDASPAALHVVGHVESVTHAISANGQAYTNIEMSLCRTVYEERPKFRTSGLPPWFDENIFADTVVGKSYYEQVLGSGVNSMVDMAGDAAGGDDPIQSAAIALTDIFKKVSTSSQGAAAFTDTVTSRPLASLEEVFAYLGATKVNDDRFDGGALDSQRQAVIIRMAEELRSGAVKA